MQNKNSTFRSIKFNFKSAFNYIIIVLYTLIVFVWGLNQNVDALKCREMVKICDLEFKKEQKENILKYNKLLLQLKELELELKIEKSKNEVR